MSFLARKVLYGLRTQGVRYLWRAPRNELVHPRLAVTRAARATVISVVDWVKGSKQDTDTLFEDCLVFAYDLSVAPVTFDFASHLAAAEIERRLRKLDGIAVVMILGPHHGVRQELPDYEATLSPAARRWRVQNILVPLLSLLPSIRGHVVCSSRKDAEALLPASPSRLYPTDFRLFLPRQPLNRVVFEHARRGVPIFPMLRASDRAREFVREFLDATAAGRRAIVISLRDSPNTPQRNSRLSEWCAFAQSLDRKIYAPIFVLDTDAAMRARPRDLDREIICEAASWSVEIRMALYEAAWLNMAIMHGPMELCWFSETARYLLFYQPLADTNQIDLMRDNGQPLYGNLEFAKPYQRIVRQGDQLCVLQQAFGEMAGMLYEMSDVRDTPKAAAHSCSSKGQL
jgi:hypothetical protein